MVSRNVNTIMSVTFWGFHQSGNTSYNLNVLKFSKDNGVPVDWIDLGTLYVELGAQNIITLYRGLFSPNYFIEKVVIAGVTDATPYSQEFPQGVIGTRPVDAGDRAPGFVNMMFYHRAVDAPKRRGLGKMFLGGLYEQDINGDFITSPGSLDTAMINWRAGLEFFTAGHAETNHTLVVLSDPDRTLPENAPVPPQRQAFGYEVQNVESSDQVHILSKRKWSRGI